MHIVSANEVTKDNLRVRDVVADSLIDNELELCRCGQSLANLWRLRRVNANPLSSRLGQGCLVKTQGGHPIHAGVFGQETGLAVSEHDHYKTVSLHAKARKRPIQ